MDENGTQVLRKRHQQTETKSTDDRSTFKYDKLEEVSKEKRKPESPFSIANILWLIAAIAVFYYTDLLRAFLYDSRINRFWFNIGVLLIGINLSIGAFLIIYLSFIKKVDSEEWERQYPTAIPLATASFAFGACCLATGVWPMWGLLTPFILFTELMGVVVLVAMLPTF